MINRSHLCWPCHVAEVNEEIQKQPPSRPPRWLREPGDGALYDPRPACCLCPVRRGALRAVVEPPKPQSAGKTPAVDDSGKVSDDAGDAQSPAQARRATLVGFFDNTAMKDNTSDGKHLGVGKATPSSMPEDISDPSEPNNSKPEITRWAHVVCAQCVPGVDFLTNPAPGVAGAVIYGLDRVPTSAFESTCSLCSRQEGVTTACGWPGLHELAFPLAATWMMLWLLLMRRECSTISDISTTLMGLFYTAYGRPRPNDAAASCSPPGRPRAHATGRVPAAWLTNVRLATVFVLRPNPASYHQQALRRQLPRAIPRSRIRL